MTLGNPGRKLGRAHPKVPELLTQKEQMLIRNAIYISFACFFEYNLHAAPLKSKGPDLAWACLFHLCPSTLFCSLSGEIFTCGTHICLDSPGPDTKILGNPFMVRCKKKKEKKPADPLHFAHFLWSRFWPLVSHMFEFQLSLCCSTYCMILSKLFNLGPSIPSPVKWE